MLPNAINFTLRRNNKSNTNIKLSKNIDQSINKNNNKNIIIPKIQNFNFNEDDLIKQKINLYQLKNFSPSNQSKTKSNIWNTNTLNYNNISNINTNNNINIKNLIQNLNYLHSRNYKNNTIENSPKFKNNILFNSCSILPNKNENKYKSYSKLYNFETLSTKESKQNIIFNKDSKNNITKTNNDLLKDLKEKSHEIKKLNFNIIKIDKNISSENLFTRNNNNTNNLKESETCKNDNLHNTKKLFYKKYNITKKMKLKKIADSQSNEKKENNDENTILCYQRHLKKKCFSIKLPKINRISLNERVFKKTEDYGNYLYNKNNLDYYYNDYFSTNNNKIQTINKVIMKNELIREKILSSLINND